jgi:CRISPR/Cas system-associated endonuclease Cas1
VKGQVYDGDGRILCKECLTRRVPLSYLAQYRYFCTACYGRTPGQLRYRQGEGRKADNRRSNPRRIYIGKQFHSQAATAEQAQRIRAHVNQRLKERQSAITR